MVEEEFENPFEAFDPEVRLAVEGLIHLGALTKDVEFCGHTFGLRTLLPADEIAAAKSIEDFRGTLKEPEAWASALVGVALTHVDGEEDFCPPVGPSKTSFAKARFNYVTSNWYWPTIEWLHREYVSLVSKQIEAVRAMQDLSAGSLPMSSPSADSYFGPGIFSDMTNTGTPGSPS